MTFTVYEHPTWLESEEASMHPGGFKITERALKHCNIDPSSTILDVGCGAGSTLNLLQKENNLQGMGVDPSASLLSYAHQMNANIWLTQAFAEHLPLTNECVDAVVSECTLSLFNAKKAIQECQRVLKPNGYFIVSDLYARDPENIGKLKDLHTGTGFPRVMDQEKIIRLIMINGFKISIWQDCSDALQQFSLCKLTDSASIDPFDLLISAAQAKLGYYFLIARKK